MYAPFENVFCIKDLTCGVRWPYSKRTLGLWTQSLYSVLPSLCCSLEAWKCNNFKCKRPLSMPTYTIILCIFFVFIIFYMLLEKNKMLVLIWCSDFSVFFDVNSHVLEFNGLTQQSNIFMTIVTEKIFSPDNYSNKSVSSLCVPSNQNM